MSPTVARRVVQSFASEEFVDELTKRERDVLALLARGHTYASIGTALGIGLGTVQSYVKAIYAKLQVGSKAEATACAARLGLV